MRAADTRLRWCAAHAPPRAGLPAVYGLYTDFLPLILFFCFTSSHYLQVGAVSIVSLLTYNTVTALTQTRASPPLARLPRPLTALASAEASLVSTTKSAASSALKAFNAQPTNAALSVLSIRATAAYNAAQVSLIRRQTDTASLLAFYVGIFSFGIGFLKLGNVMNLMSPPVISGFASAAAITIGMGQLKNTFGYGKDFTSSSQLHSQIKSFIDWRGEINTRATWTGWLWVAILLIFKYAGRAKWLDVTVKGVKVPISRFLKITGPVIVRRPLLRAPARSHTRVPLRSCASPPSWPRASRSCTSRPAASCTTP